MDIDKAIKDFLENTKCDVCGEPATNAAWDMVEVPSDGGLVKKVSVGPVHFGCDKHPAVSKTINKK